MNIKPLLEKSARDHDHLCPRQVLGVRMGLAGMEALGFQTPPANKQLLVITETDGCFTDGLSAATGCTTGHRTLRVEDYGKAAAVFVDTLSRKCVRLAPAADIRKKAPEYSPDQETSYFAQLHSYQFMPNDVMFTITPVELNASIESIVSRPGLRVICDNCAEEIMNEREVRQNDQVLCQACANGAYYHHAKPETIHLYSQKSQNTLI